MEEHREKGKDDLTEHLNVQASVEEALERFLRVEGSGVNDMARQMPEGPAKDIMLSDNVSMMARERGEELLPVVLSMAAWCAYRGRELRTNLDQRLAGISEVEAPSVWDSSSVIQYTGAARQVRSRKDEIERKKDRLSWTIEMISRVIGKFIEDLFAGVPGESGNGRYRADFRGQQVEILIHKINLAESTAIEPVEDEAVA